MGDSEEEHDLKRRDRNKFKRERENLGNEEEFDNKRRNLAQPDFDSKWKTKREYSPTNRSLKRNKRDPRDSRSFTIPWHPWDGAYILFSLFVNLSLCSMQMYRLYSYANPPSICRPPRTTR